MVVAHVSPLRAAEQAESVSVPGLLLLLSHSDHVPGPKFLGVDVGGWLASWPVAFGWPGNSCLFGVLGLVAHRVRAAGSQAGLVVGLVGHRV